MTELISPTGLSDLISRAHPSEGARPFRLCPTAPNVYNIPGVLGQTREGNKKQAPSFTISGRQKEHLDDRVLTPGPGTYDSAKSEFTKSRSPAYSISSRYQLPSDSTQKPGPGAHYPEKSGLSRHNQPLIVTAFCFIFSRTLVGFSHRLTKAPSTDSVSVSLGIVFLKDTDCVDAISISKDRKDIKDAELMEDGALVCRGPHLISGAAAYRSSDLIPNLLDLDRGRWRHFNKLTWLETVDDDDDDDS
ncbi:unnamed protein product [Timema podura]|uniref:Uncharacterized protein n=1 Tax=Timema podura TaxID=61482 RepID=A0ABN7NMU7_TIMPD|nr:unnamed protein product [Timema podura]